MSLLEPQVAAAEASPEPERASPTPTTVLAVLPPFDFPPTGRRPGGVSGGDGLVDGSAQSYITGYDATMRRVAPSASPDSGALSWGDRYDGGARRDGGHTALLSSYDAARSPGVGGPRRDSCGGDTARDAILRCFALSNPSGLERTCPYAYDGQDILRESITDGANATTYLYLHGPGIDKGGPNFYAYVRNRPVGLVDPSGLASLIPNCAGYALGDPGCVGIPDPRAGDPNDIPRDVGCSYLADCNAQCATGKTKVIVCQLNHWKWDPKRGDWYTSFHMMKQGAGEAGFSGKAGMGDVETGIPDPDDYYETRMPAAPGTYQKTCWCCNPKNRIPGEILHEPIGGAGCVAWPLSCCSSA